MELDVTHTPVCARIRRVSPDHFRLTLEYPSDGEYPDRVIAMLADLLRSAPAKSADVAERVERVNDARS